MHVIILILLLLLLYFLIVNWEISLPVLVFLIYLAFTFVRDNPIKNKWRYHSLWCFFQLTLIFGIVYREDIGDFLWKLEMEDRSWNDELLENRMNDAFFVRSLTDDVEVDAPQNDIIIGELKFGMSPFRVVRILDDSKELNNFHIGSVSFRETKRYYSDGDLYGVTMDFYDSSEKEMSKADSVARFLSHKYGKPHVCLNNDSVFKTEWHFNHKHIVVEKVASEDYGVLSIYHPVMLRNKIRKIKEEEAKEKQEEEDRLRAIKEEKMKKEQDEKRKAEEEKRNMEEKNKRLLESL